MIYQDIMQAVLLKPASEGATNLRIVSGYASPAMLENHLRQLKQANLSVGIHLTVGMTKGTLDAQDRRGYQDVVAADWGGSRVLGVRVISKGPQVHSKVYVWDGPAGYHKAFAGSANYSVSAMVEENTREVCAEVDWTEADQYVRGCEANARSVIYSSGDRKKWRDQELALSNAMPEESAILWDQYVDIPLLVRRGGRLEVPAKSGVNWGQLGATRRQRAESGVPKPQRKVPGLLSGTSDQVHGLYPKAWWVCRGKSPGGREGPPV